MRTGSHCLAAHPAPSCQGVRAAFVIAIGSLLAAGIWLVLWMNRSTYAKSVDQDLGRIYAALAAYEERSGALPQDLAGLRELEEIEPVLRTMERARAADAEGWLEYHPDVSTRGDILLRDGKTGHAIRADGTIAAPP